MDYPDYCSPSQGYDGDGEVPEGRCTPPWLFPGQANDDNDPSPLFSDQEMDKLEQLIGPTLHLSPSGHADSRPAPMQEPYYVAGGSCSSSLFLPRSQTKGAKPRRKKNRDSICQAWTAGAPTSDWGQAAAAPLEGPLHLSHSLPYTTTPSPFSSSCSPSSCDSFDTCQDYEPLTTAYGMGPAVAGEHHIPRQRKPKSDLKNMTPEERRLHNRQINLSPSRRSREKKKANKVALEDTLQRLELDNCRLHKDSQQLEDMHTKCKAIADIMRPWLPQGPTTLPVDDDPQAPPFPPSPGRHPF